MDYIFTTLLIVMGVLFHVMQCVRKLRVKFPRLGFRSIWVTFISEEWDSLIVSFFCWIIYQLLLWVMLYNGTEFAPWFDHYGMYVLAIVWGYAGQRLAYKVLGTAEQILQKKVDKLNDQ